MPFSLRFFPRLITVLITVFLVSGCALPQSNPAAPSKTFQSKQVETDIVLSTTPPPGQPAQARTALATSNLDQPANPDASLLVENLTQQGFVLELTGRNPPTALVAPAPGAAYRLSEGDLHVHWFPD